MNLKDAVGAVTINDSRTRPATVDDDVRVDVEVAGHRVVLVHAGDGQGVGADIRGWGDGRGVGRGHASMEIRVENRFPQRAGSGAGGSASVTIAVCRRRDGNGESRRTDGRGGEGCEEQPGQQHRRKRPAGSVVART